MKRSNRHIPVAVLAILMSFAFAITLNAQDTNWTNFAGGDFHDPLNWSNGIPGSGDNAIFDLDQPYSVNMTANNVARSFDQRDGTLTITGGHTFEGLEDSFNESGLALVGAGTRLELAQDFHLRQLSVVTVGDGASIKTGETIVSGLVGSIATIDLASDSEWTCSDMFLGTSNGLNDRGIGTVNVLGDSALRIGISFASSGIHVGAQGTAARLFVRHGSLIFNPENQFQVGPGIGSIGEVTIHGTGSRITNGGNAYIGYSGNGNLIIQNGGSFEAYSMFVAYDEESTSSVTVSGTGSLLNLQPQGIKVGFNGTGELLVEDGAQLLSSSFFDVGLYDAVGTATFTGPGSYGSCTSSYIAANSLDSTSATGTLNVLDGAVVDNEFGCYVAIDPGTTGTVTVSGTGSRLNASSRLTLGTASELNADGGDAILALSSGGVINIGTENPNLSTTGLVLSGVNEKGHLVMRNGAALQNDGVAILGYSDNNSGKANLVGAGTLWENGLSMKIGVAGLGIVTVDEGAVATAETIMMADQSTGNALVTIDGGGSELSSTSDIVIGNEGTATVTVSNGGLISAADQLSIGAGSLLSIVDSSGDAASWSIDGVLDASGSKLTGTMIFYPGGEIQVDSSTTTLVGDVFNQNGNIHVETGATVAMLGNYVGNGTFSGDGEIVFWGDVGFGPNPQSISIPGDVSLRPTSNVKFKLGGDAGGEFDRIQVDTFSTGVLMQSGFEIELINGFTLSPGQEFVIVEANSVPQTNWSGFMEGDVVGNFGGTDLLISYVAGDGNDIALYTEGIQLDVSVDSINVTRGIGTTVAEPFLVNISDNLDLTIQRNQSDLSAWTEFELTGTSPFANPISLSITLEGAVFARTTVTQTVWLYDFVAADWVEVHSSNANRFIDSVVTATASGNLSRFVQPGTRQVRARVRYRSVNPRQSFTSNTDLFSWTIGL